MISQLAKGDYEDLIAEGLKPSLEDFDRLNQIALRLTDGGETTATNAPRIGWAGDIPFHEPTCAAFAWYLSFIDRANFDGGTKDACWFYALYYARETAAFAVTAPSEIKTKVNEWLASLPVTRDEIVRACRFAATGFDDAVPGRNAPDERTPDEVREDKLGGISTLVAVASASTGIDPATLAVETPARLKRMVDEVRWLNHREDNADISRLRVDYDLTYREIRRRLKAAKEADDGK